MTERNCAIDFIKTVSILAVICIHISTAFLDRTAPFSFNFDVLLFINQFSRFAVPLFFASSGFLLALKYHKSFPVKDFYRKRLLRILPSYLFWTLIYYLIVFPHSVGSLFSLHFLNTFLTGSAAYQLYFIPAIFTLYLIFPFLIKGKRFFLSKLFLILFFVSTFFYLYFVYLSGFIPPLYPPLRFALYNLFPFLIGIYTALHFDAVFGAAKKYTWIVFSGAIILGTLIFSESYTLFKTYQVDRFLREQWRPSVMAYSLFCGIILTWMYEKYLKNKDKQILFLSKFSFGVFFIHVGILVLFLEVIDMNKWYGLFPFLIVTIGTITISYGAIYILSKIPGVGKIISAT